MVVTFAKTTCPREENDICCVVVNSDYSTTDKTHWNLVRDREGTLRE